MPAHNGHDRQSNPWNSEVTPGSDSEALIGHEQKPLKQMRAMQACQAIIAGNTTLLSTDRERFKWLNGMTPEGGNVPVQRSGDPR